MISTVQEDAYIRALIPCAQPRAAVAAVPVKLKHLFRYQVASLTPVRLMAVFDTAVLSAKDSHLTIQDLQAAEGFDADIHFSLVLRSVFAIDTDELTFR